MKTPLKTLRKAVVSRSRLRIPERASDTETATLRYLLYGILPAWLVPGLLDWWQHRRTRIEDTAGVRESLIHLLMMAEVGLPITLALLCEINPLVLTIMAATIAAHEATALWDVKTAVESDREVSRSNSTSTVSWSRCRSWGPRRSLACTGRTSGSCCTPTTGAAPGGCSPSAVSCRAAISPGSGPRSPG
ncbi:hypothetical protein [Amycolatopsis sp. NPDC004079]|uniref:hypothetical protein n=1 Tax=Amycolatopsis sp. NPDC004079 TaxID=3154549 RepID=UPI0033B8553B